MHPPRKYERRALLRETAGNALTEKELRKFNDVNIDSGKMIGKDSPVDAG
jgi:hypothetical protein